MTIITPADAVPFVSTAEMLSTLTDLARTAEAAGAEAYNRGESESAFACWLAGAAYRSDIAQIHEGLADLPCFTVAKDVSS